MKRAFVGFTLKATMCVLQDETHIEDEKHFHKNIYLFFLGGFVGLGGLVGLSGWFSLPGLP